MCDVFLIFFFLLEVEAWNGIHALLNEGLQYVIGTGGICSKKDT